MSLKTAGNIVSVFETAIIVLSFAGWAALGFPSWKLVAAFALLCLLGLGVLRWLASRQT
jgi:hypothetical protein